MTPSTLHGVAASHALATQKAALLVHIGNARNRTAAIGKLLANDLCAAEEKSRSILAGLTVLKAALVTAGMVWSLNAPSTLGRGRRFITVGVSLLSTMRAIRSARKAGAILNALTQPIESRERPL